MKSMTLLSMLIVTSLSLNVFAESLHERCEKQKTVMAAYEENATQLNTDLLNINKQIKELQAKKSNLTKEIVVLKKMINKEKANSKKMCAPLKQCTIHEGKIEKLKDKIAPLAEELKKIRDEIHRRNTNSATLNQEVEKIETSYQQTNCDTLVAGETAQTTIDRCNELFTKWNVLQKRINSLKTSVAKLRTKYQKVMRKMKLHAGVLARLTKQMRQNCSHSAKIAVVDDIEKEQKSFQSLKDDIAKFDSRLKKIRLLKIKPPKMTRPKIKKVTKDKKDKRKRPKIKKVR
jgi:chromosome segregation ATPase